MSPRILIIDPDEDQLIILRSALQEEGHSVEVARDGLEGFERFKEFRPDLVITELMIDRLSGFELSARIATNDEFRAPVIFYTGFYRDERARKEVVLKYGASGYFVKPFQLQALKRAVADRLGQSTVPTPEPTIPKLPPPRPESKRQFTSPILEGPLEWIKRPAVHKEETVAETPEISHSVEPSVNREHLVSVPPSLKSHGQDRSAEQIGAWHPEPPIVQVTTPLTQESSATQPPTETESTRDDVPNDILPQPEPVVRDERADYEVFAESFPGLSEPPSPAPVYRSRPFQILAAMALLGAAFFLFRGPGSSPTQKPDVTPQQQPEHVQTANPVSPSLETASPPALTAEPGALETSPLPSAVPNPESKGLTSNEAGNLSSVAALQNADAIAARGGLSSEGSRSASSHGTNLMISDVTGGGGPPYLQKSKKPVVSRDMAQSVGRRPLVIRVVISAGGKVIEATSLNESENNASLSRAALAAIQNWEFSPIRGGSEKTWTRYFSFRFTDGSE